MGEGNPGKWWVENEIVLPCIKFPTLVTFLFVRVGRVGKLEGKGGVARQSDIPPCIKFPTFVPILYIRVGRVGEWVGGGGLPDNQIFPPCIKSPTFVPFYSAFT